LIKQSQNPETNDLATRKFFSLAENLPVVISRFDRDLRYLYVNPASQRVLGIPSEKFIGKTNSEVGISSELAANFDRFLKEALATGKPSDMEFEITTPNGNRHFQTLITPEYSENSSIVSILCITFDLTPRKMIEAELSQAKNNLEATVAQRTAEMTKAVKRLEETNKFNSMLLEHSPMPIMVTNPDSSVMYVNKAIEKLTGFTPKELLGTKVPYPFWPESRWEEYLTEMGQDRFKKKEVLEKTFVNKQGQEIWVEMTVIPVMVNRRLKYIISTWINLTEEKKMRREIELYSRKMMEVLEAERKRIANELHDDTAQSLAIVSLEMDSLSRSGEIKNKNVLERLQHLQEDVRRTMQSIRQYSYELRPGMIEHLGLKAALEQLVDEMSEKNNLDIDFNVSGKERDLPDETKIALFRITQEAINNIVQHAKATEASVSLGYTRQETRLTIKDNGQGFDQSQEREASLKAGDLGLVAIREWARLIGADLKIESKLNRGTTIKTVITI
jgi:PAS domain S-box-containing protein